MDHALMERLRVAIQGGTIPSIRVYRRVCGIYIRRNDRWVDIPLVFESEDDTHDNDTDDDVDVTFYISSYGRIARGEYIDGRVVTKEHSLPPGAFEQQALNYAILRLLSTPKQSPQFPWIA